MNHPSAGHTRILAWMCAFIAVNQLGFGSVMPVLALYARSFDVGQSAIGLAIAIYGLARFLIAVPAGQLADRAGRRHALALGGLVTAAGNLLCAWAPTYPAFITARFIAGAGAGLVMITGQIVLADITTPANRGRAMAVYQGVFLFAVGIGPLFGGVLAERSGLAAPFVVYAVRATESWHQSPTAPQCATHLIAVMDPPVLDAALALPNILDARFPTHRGVGFLAARAVSPCERALRGGDYPAPYR